MKSRHMRPAMLVSQPTAGYRCDRKGLAMDRNTLLGGNPFGVIIRLVLISIVVGIILSALGITPRNLFYHLEILARRLYDLGFGVFENILGYLILGAVVVVPIWLVARVFGLISGSKSSDNRDA